MSGSNYSKSKIGNNYAKKDKKRDAQIVVRAFVEDKDKWIKAANSDKLSVWITNTLNAACENKKG
jgi:hypothetical protein